MLAVGLLWQASKSGILRQPNGEDHGHNELGTWSHVMERIATRMSRYSLLLGW